MYKFTGVKSFIFLVLTGLVFIGFPREVKAASNLLLETTSRGMAKASLTINPQTTKSRGTQPSNSLIRILPLPFELSPIYTISSPDNIKISVLSSSNGYTLLAILAPKWNQPINFQINNALNLVEDKTQARAKFKFDFSYKYLTIHRNIFNHPETITGYDVTIFFPVKHNRDELSFEPSGSWQEVIAGQKYTFPGSLSGVNSSTSEVWFSFPSLYKEEFNLIYLVLSLITGIILSLISSQTLINPSQKSSVLQLLIFLSFIYFIVLIPNLFRVRPLELLVIVSGPTITVTFILSGSIYLLLSKQYQAEVSGKVKKNNGDPANYHMVSLFRDGKNTFDRRSYLEVEDEGKYKFRVWCWNKQRKYKVHVSSDDGVQLASSNVLEVRAKDRKEFDDIIVPLQTVQAAQHGVP